MHYDLGNLDPSFGYKLLTSTVTPRPIAWVTTLGRDGLVNAAPYSFFNVMGSLPPVIGLGLTAQAGAIKDTARNILANAEFVVNLVPNAMAEAMCLTSVDAPEGISELALAGLESVASVAVAPPRIKGCPVALECRCQNAVETGPAQYLVIGEVIGVHIEDRFLLDSARGHVDTPALDLVARMHGAGSYARRPELFEMQRPRWGDLAPVPNG